MLETLKSGAKQSASRVYGKRVLTSDEGYNIQAAKEEKKAEELLEKERNKREREEKRKQKEARKLCAAEAKSKKKTHKKNRIRWQLISHRTRAVSVYSHMNRTSNKAQEQSGWSVFTVDGSMKNVLIMWSMIRMAKRSSVLHVVFEMFM